MVAGQVAALLLLIAVGYGVRKKNIVSATCSADLSKVLFYVISPALNFNTFSKEFSLQDFEMHYKTLLSGLAVVIVLIILSTNLFESIVMSRFAVIVAVILGIATHNPDITAVMITSLIVIAPSYNNYTIIID